MRFGVIGHSCLSLAPDLRIASYQYGFDGSTFVVQDGECTLMGPTECKVRGRPPAERQCASGPSTVTRSDTLPDGRANPICIREGLLADAIEKRIAQFIQGAMRLRTELRPGGVQEDFVFHGLLTMWELGYLPLRGLINARFVSVVWRQRREVFDLMIGFLRMAGGRGRLSDHFASPRTERLR